MMVPFMLQGIEKIVQKTKDVTIEKTIQDYKPAPPSEKISDEDLGIDHILERRDKFLAAIRSNKEESEKFKDLKEAVDWIIYGDH